METYLHRKNLNEKNTEGNFYIPDETGKLKWFCNTLEDKVRALPGQWTENCKVFAETAIPYGRYKLLVTWSPHFGRKLTAVLNVPSFTGVRIHNGTTEKNSEGCILVSYHDNDTTHSLVNERNAMNDICDIIDKKQVSEDCWINIVSQMPDNQ